MLAIFLFTTITLAPPPGGFRPHVVQSITCITLPRVQRSRHGCRPIRQTADKKLIGSRTRPEVEALLAAPIARPGVDVVTMTLLLTLYNSGARVSTEVTTLKRDQVCFGPPTFLHLEGKGRKEPRYRCGPTQAGLSEPG